MRVAAALIRRDWRIARRRRTPFVLDAVSVLATATLFYYMGRSVTREGSASFFAFAVAGLAILRLQAAIPPVLDRTNVDLASGTLELYLAAPCRTATVVLGSVGFSMLRGLAGAVLMTAVAIGIFGAPCVASVAAFVGIALGLLGGMVMFAGLAAGTFGILMVVREAGALGTLVTMLVPVLGGAYFPLSVLPGPIRLVARALPFHRGADLIRGGMLHGRAPAGDAALLIAESAALLGLGLAVAAWGVHTARRGDTLAME